MNVHKIHTWSQCANNQTIKVVRMESAFGGGFVLHPLLLFLIESPLLRLLFPRLPGSPSIGASTPFIEHCYNNVFTTHYHYVYPLEIQQPL